ncbi:MAG: hypothetical protein Q8M31_11550 [Beijerinckiaceae bacterium]|nr:hypothetical protein [Beijerinckiaceae bacterium]
MGLIAVASAALTVSGARAQTAAILIPGAGGPVPIDFLMRNTNAFSSAGVEAFVATSPQQAVALSQKLKSANRRVFLVGMSRGGMMASGAVAAGAKVDGVVFVSTGLNAVRQRIGSPSRLPQTLIVHHRNDGCDRTSPREVASFVQWSGGRARVAWMDTQGREPPNPCGPRGAHGFYMQDGPAVRAILSFVR